MHTEPSVGKNSAWLAASAAFVHFVNFGTFVFLARVLGPMDIGLVAFALIIIDTVRVLIVSGIPDALIRSEVWDNRLATGAFILLLSMGIVLVGIACFTSLLFYWLDSHSYELDILAALSPLFLIEAFSVVPEALLRRKSMFQALSTRNMLSTLATGLIGCALALLGWGVWSLVVSRLVGAVFASVLTWSASRWMPQRGSSIQDVGRLIAFTGWLTMAQLVGQFSYRIPDFAIGTILGPAALATYRVGARIVDVALQMMVHPVQQTALPVFCAEHAKGNLNSTYRDFCSGLAILLLPAFLCLSVSGSDIVLVLFGPKWELSGSVLTVISLSCVVSALVYLSMSAQIAAGKVRSIFLIAVLTLIGSLPMFAVARYGVIFVAISVVLRDCFITTIILYVLRREIYLNIIGLLKAVAPTFFCAGLVYLATLLLKGAMEPGLKRLTTIFVSTAAGYFTLVKLIAPQSAARTASMIRDLRLGPINRVPMPPEM